MRKHIKIFLTATTTIFILLGFALPLNPVGNWYQQFMPNLNGRQISDITFLDSLVGYAVATQTSDSSYILKTNNGGDNWQIIYRQLFAMTHVQFFNTNTGYAGGGYLYKTTNGGFNWAQINTPASTVEKMFILNDSTFWYVNSNSLVGGVFYTSNGGANWTPQFSGGNQNPNKIYMYNARIGFMSNSSALPNIYKTVNGGINWNLNLPNEYFTDMFFTDSLTGWKCMPGFIAGDSCVKKTTNGGLNWVKQTLPSGGIIIAPVIGKFSHLNADTIWGVGSAVFYGGGQFRGVLFRTTNGGSNWLFQVPDTSIHITGSYSYIKFINKNIGWAYHVSQGGVHTTTGGDPVWLTGVQQISNEIPKEFKLYQNYPNPFNPVTNIKYQITNTRYVLLSVYDVTGKHIIDLVNQKQSAGTYEVDFSGIRYSSGVYFYKLTLSNKKEVFTETKKMILVK